MRLATGQEQRDPQRERDRHTHVSPAPHCSHHRLLTPPLTGLLASDDVLTRARRAPPPGMGAPPSAHAPRSAALVQPLVVCPTAAPGEGAAVGRASINHATRRLPRRTPPMGPQHRIWLDGACGLPPARRRWPQRAPRATPVGTAADGPRPWRQLDALTTRHAATTILEGASRGLPSPGDTLGSRRTGAWPRPPRATAWAGPGGRAALAAASRS